MLVYVIASKPYPEKVSNSKFYIDLEDAKTDYSLIREDIRIHLAIYEAIVEVKKEKIYPEGEK